MIASRPLRLATLCLVLALGACAVANVTPVVSGENAVSDRLTLVVDQPWNQFARNLRGNIPTWTHEGITLDSLQFWVGVKDGAPIVGSPKDKGAAALTFKSAMQPAEIVALYQSLYTRDGSSFTLDRLEPVEFLGQPGFRFAYSMVRKVDDLRLRGMAWGAVRNGELFLIDFSAPRLAIFDRLLPSVQALAASARVKG